MATIICRARDIQGNDTIEAAVTVVNDKGEDFTLEYGFSNGLQRGSARRWTTGFRYRKDSFGLGDELPPPDSVAS